MLYEISHEDHDDLADLVIPKIIEDVFWITPEWFSKMLDQRFGEKKIAEILDYKGMVPAIPLAPNHLAIWGAMSYNNDYIYPRALGATVRMCYSMLNPITIYAIQNNILESGFSEELLENMMAKYEFDLAQNTNVLCAKKADFDEFSLEYLVKLIATMQGVSGQIGEHIFKQYMEGTSFMLDTQPTIAYYSNVVNLTAYCWQMTVNDQIKSMDVNELKTEEAFRVLFAQPLHKKGKNALCQLMDSIRNKFRRSPSK